QRGVSHSMPALQEFYNSSLYLITPESAVNVFTIVKKLLFVNSTTQLSWKIYLNGICHQPNFGIIFMPEILYKLRDN
ncbi:hypothetical protein MEO42_01080, partial [Dolichospermum sp. ST_sed6]|nr:hypothetical protein [Dolichospermum sp. ST_sed6]